jgi:6-phosphogluconolactonase
MVLLGMGPDGHTASLFPGAPELDEMRRLMVPVHRPDLPQPWRVSITMPVINAARRVLMMVGNPEKAAMVRRAIAGDPAIPAGRLRPAGRLTWLVTEDAAAELERPEDP